MKLFYLTVHVATLCCAFLLLSCGGQNLPDRASTGKGAADETESVVAPVNLPAPPSTNASPDAVVYAAAAQNAQGDATKGKETFEQCAICHNVDSDEEKMGPALKGVFKKAKLKNGKAASEANVRAIVKEGGNGMPGYDEILSADEMQNLIAYLKTV